VAATPGATAAAGRVVGKAALLGPDGQVIRNGQSAGLGVNVAADPALRGFTVASGHVPRTAGQAAVDQATAADEHFRLGQTVKVVDHTGRVRAFTLVGTLDFGADHEFGNTAVTAFGTATTFSVTGRPGYDEIVARAAPGTSQATLVRRLRAQPALARDQVQTGAQLATAEADAAVHFTTQFTTLVLVFALIALVVACIVIYNTFNILITQRGRELALLRCVGASRGQVFGGTLLESLIAGLIASAAGAAAGLGFGWGLQRIFAAFGAPVPAGPVVLSPGAILIPMAAGVAVTLAAALIPARSATRVAPVAALGRQDEPPVTARIGAGRATLAAVLTVIGIALATLGLRHVSGRPGFLEIGAGGCACFLAVLALGPVIVPPVIGFLGWLPGRLAGVTTRLAAANARRNPHRVAATTAALTIGLTLMTVFTVILSSAQASSSSQLSQHYPFGYEVQATGTQPVPATVLRSLHAAAALGLIVPFYGRQARVNGVQEDVGAFSRPSLGVMVNPTMAAGTITAVRPGTAAVEQSELSRLGTRQGGTVTVATARGPETLRVGAVYRTSGNGPLGGVLLSVPDYQRGFRPAGPQAVFINQAPGATTAAARAAVTAAAAHDPLLAVSTEADYRSGLAQRVDQILAIFGTLLGLAVLIALFGISSTLSLSVIERTRESALLRALGLTRGQLRRMLLTEALFMAALAVVLGVGLGATFGWVMVHAFIKSAGGAGVLSIPYRQIALFVGIAVVAALLAACGPARSAARVAVISAMAET
jgi:putative ABC transport system permease protein